jgi:hypothetical protein
MSRVVAFLSCTAFILLLAGCDLPPGSNDDYQSTSSSFESQQQDTYEPPSTRYTDSNGNCNTQDCS